MDTVPGATHPREERSKTGHPCVHSDALGVLVPDSRQDMDDAGCFP